MYYFDIWFIFFKCQKEKITRKSYYKNTKQPKKNVKAKIKKSIYRILFFFFAIKMLIDES